MARSDRSGAIQYGALPYRIRPTGGVEVLLLTSRGVGRWVIPKGWPIPGQKPAEVAALEAWEEAGLQGAVSRKPLGSYHYSKLLADGEARLCECIVYLLRVTAEAETWPEQSQRRRAWFPKQEAATLVEEGALALLIQNLLSTPTGCLRHRG